MVSRLRSSMILFAALLQVGCVPSNGSGEHPAESLAGVGTNRPGPEAEPQVGGEPPVTGIVSAADQGLPPELQELDRTWTGD